MLTAAAFLPLRAAIAQPIEVTVDARDAVKRVPVRVTIPAKPGPLTLCYPRWVPGAHEPVGPLRNVVGLKMAAGNTDLPWKRDPYDAYSFTCNVPVGADRVTVTFDYIPRNDGEGEIEYGVAGSDKIALVNWGALLFFPKGASARTTAFSPRLRLPDNWKYATALTMTQESSEGVQFAPVPMETLADSPVMAGAVLKTIRVDDGNDVPHYLCLTADSPAVLPAALTPAFLESMQRLVRESGALFGARHYRAFRYLVLVSDRVPVGGLEHHECSVNVLVPAVLGPRGTQDSPSYWFPNLIPHEFVHSWNGKYRMPEGLAKEDFNGPHATDLLWVYEGLTEYLGEVLMIRCGFWSEAQWRPNLLRKAVYEGTAPARLWESLGDTAAANPLISRGGVGETMRTNLDIYDEGFLLWLEADMVIRRETAGKKCLDDFCRVFFGGENGPPVVKPYTQKDVAAALKAVVPGYDWDGFLTTRLNATGNAILGAGLEKAGWRITLTDKVPPGAIASSGNYRFSLGLMLNPQTGVIDYVAPDSAAAKAGLERGMRIMGISGKVYTAPVLRQAVRATKEPNAPPLNLLIADKDIYRTVRVEYNGGEKTPILTRDESLPDGIAAIARPRVPVPLGPPLPVE